MTVAVELIFRGDIPSEKYMTDERETELTYLSINEPCCRLSRYC